MNKFDVETVKPATPSGVQPQTLPQSSVISVPSVDSTIRMLKYEKESRAESQGRRVKKMTENEKILSHGITRMNTDKKERN